MTSISPFTSHSYLIFVLSTSVRISESTTKLDLVSDSNRAIHDINHVPDHAVRWKREGTSKYRQKAAYTGIFTGQSIYHDIAWPDKNTITLHCIALSSITTPLVNTLSLSYRVNPK
jgi:hypothetical protein